MLKSYLVSAVRNLAKNKAYFLINFFGLVVGIASCLLITLYIQDELTYDDFHEHKERIFRLTTSAKFRESDEHVAVAMWGVAPALQEQYPEVEKAVRLLPPDRPATVTYQDKVAYEKKFFTADADVFAVFSYPLLQGEAKTALEGPNKIVLTQKTARKYFAAQDPLGKSLRIGPTPYQVTGVMADLPSNTDLRFDALLSMSDPTEERDDWVYTYLLLKRSDNVQELVPKLVEFAQQPMLSSGAGEGTTLRLKFHLAPITQVHFQRGLSWDTPKGSTAYVYIFSFTALLILLIACINYINLAVVQSLRRSTEVGMRKVFGAQKEQLVKQFMGESGLMALVALVVALVVVALALPVYNGVTGKEFTLASLFNWTMLLSMLVMFVVVGILTGLYPAFFLSAYQPVKVLKSKVYAHTKVGVKEVLVTVQFVIAIAVVIATVVIYRQLSLVRQVDLGFTRDPVVVLSIPPDQEGEALTASLQNEIRRLAGVKAVASGDEGALPGSVTSMDIFLVDKGGQTIEKVFKDIYVDEHYLKLLGLELVAGRNFTPDRPGQVLVNEALVKEMGWKEPVGTLLSTEGQESEIVGVVKNYNYVSLHNRIDPLVLNYAQFANKVFVRLSRDGIEQGISQVKGAWNRLLPAHPFEYGFLDKNFDLQYKAEEQMKTIFTSFCLLTVFLSFLGILGISAYSIQQRMKETAVRKILGASKQNIVVLLCKQYLYLVGIAMLVSCPAAGYLMHHWLKGFEYKTTIGPGVYLLSGAVALLIIVVTAGWYAVRAASAAPVKFLRYE